jgi:hypothetical protein
MLSGPSLEMVAEAVLGPTPGEAVDATALLFGGSVLLGTYFTARLPLWGVEVRPDRLIARGVLLTRRYRRSDIARVKSLQVTGLADWMLGVLMNSPSTVFYVLRVQLSTGRTRTLYASHSSKPDIDRAARIVTAWLTSGRAVVSTAPSAEA